MMKSEGDRADFLLQKKILWKNRETNQFKSISSISTPSWDQETLPQGRLTNLRKELRIQFHFLMISSNHMIILCISEKYSYYTLCHDNYLFCTLTFKYLIFIDLQNKIWMWTTFLAPTPNLLPHLSQINIEILDPPLLK
jgi:hypothetical protein